MTVQEKININNKPIVLIGMMGVGKSTIGRRLAAVLRRDFIDTDTFIERAQGAQISEIFEKSGEAFFRRLESQTIIDLFESEKNTVIATGGGAVTNEATLAAMKEKTISIWLKADPEKLTETLVNDTKRPLIQSCKGDKAKLRSRLSELCSLRDPLYSQADLVVAAHEKNVAETVKAITNRFSL
ncbi:MAG: shikimate kinase [Micavibrio sp.]|nr:shikimate kinase [Micavibrio sp.]